jgi:hypothetical protein
MNSSCLIPYLIVSPLNNDIQVIFGSCIKAQKKNRESQKRVKSIVHRKSTTSILYPFIHNQKCDSEICKCEASSSCDIHARPPSAANVHLPNLAGIVRESVPSGEPQHCFGAAQCTRLQSSTSRGCSVQAARVSSRVWDFKGQRQSAIGRHDAAQLEEKNS